MSYEAKWDNKSNVKLDTRYLTPKSQQIHLHYFAFLLPSTLILVSRTFSVLFDYFLMGPASPSVPLPDAPCRFRVFALLSFRTPQDVSKRDKRPCCITSSAMQSGGSTRHHQKIRETQRYATTYGTTLLQITGKGWKALCCTISCGWWLKWEKNMFQTLGITVAFNNEFPGTPFAASHFLQDILKGFEQWSLTNGNPTARSLLEPPKSFNSMFRS